MSDSFDLPQELVVEILVRLPIQDLVKFTAVCKSWNSLIKNPTFISIYFGKTVSLPEHCARDFPLWISPIQARILPVTDTQLDFCNEVTRRLKASGIQAEVCHGKHLAILIRDAWKQKIPLMAVVGPKEVETDSVTVRSRFGYGAQLGTMKIDEFSYNIKQAIKERTSLYELLML
ncbi:hypothetical protein COLO4_10294 [Corchorus olitorius]|uniref:F-box domain-containing protein n=1 Tax=Corchorus olitorius TaxID=93759 RepID=A0A1R3K988_9ROSI|nr:hypothetical protein COLO4_10294 [Corchorus olitorius]